MKKFFSFVFLICLGLNYCFAQKDSMQYNNPTYWTPRFSIGVQKNPYLELGISKLGFSGDALEFGSWCFYGSFEANYRANSIHGNYFYGAKFGFETSWAIFMWAIETKYIADSRDSRFILTPKIGLSLLGIVNLLYGYNIGYSLEKFDGI